MKSGFRMFFQAFRTNKCVLCCLGEELSSQGALKFTAGLLGTSATPCQSNVWT